MQPWSAGLPVWTDGMTSGGAKCLPQDRWPRSPHQQAPRSSKVSYLKWASGADWSWGDRGLQLGARGRWSGLC